MFASSVDHSKTTRIHSRNTMKQRLIALLLAVMTIAGMLSADTYSGACGTALTYTLTTESGLLTVSGEGKMANYTAGSAPWYAYRADITAVNISSGVTSIGYHAFNGCTNLVSVSMGSGITAIGEYAFKNCAALTSIDLPEGVAAVGKQTFFGCSSLTSVVIPNSALYIGDLAFFNCTALTSVTFGESIAEIRYQAFYGCRSLTIANLPGSVTSIGEQAFSGCTALTAVTMSNNVTALGAKAFYKCNSLVSVTLSSRITEIADATFFNCNALKEVAIPPAVTAIGESAFQNCSTLASVTVPKGVTGVGKYAFYGCTAMTAATFKGAVPVFGSYPFGGGNNCTFYVPEGTKEAYIEALSVNASRVEVTIPSPDIVLREDGDNAYYDSFADAYHNRTVTTATLNRRFKAGMWSTLCLPFNVSTGMMTALSMRGRVYEFRYATGNADQCEDCGVTLYFSQATSIQAGKCYIVNANTKMAAKESFVFSNVTIDLTADKVPDLTVPGAYDGLDGDRTGGDIELVGTLRPGTLTGSLAGHTYMGLKDNKIWYPNSSSGSAIRAYRGIFRITVPINAQRVRIVADGDTVTELQVVNGQLLDAPNPHPARKFIKNGNLLIERNGITYTAQGAEL